MPRVPRSLTVVPNQPHHVILRGNNRRRLFSYPREHQFFLRRLLWSSREHGVPVHSNVQMSNHVHLVATPRDAQQLARFVGGFAQTYAQYRNRRRSASGKLFEERYKCIPITSEEQMAVTLAYVELNPVRASVCKEPENYRWTTYHRHCGFEGRELLFSELWQPSSWYVSLGADPVARANAFRDWFDHYRARDDWSDVYADPNPGSDQKRFERPNRRTAI